VLWILFPILGVYRRRSNVVNERKRGRKEEKEENPKTGGVFYFHDWLVAEFETNVFAPKREREYFKADKR
jgi:UDP-N-acetylmuramyl pentapeptide phosphotransferase/UDP-N-acetylglucosamine-1-phosphate transferase